MCMCLLMVAPPGRTLLSKSAPNDLLQRQPATLHCTNYCSKCTTITFRFIIPEYVVFY